MAHVTLGADGRNAAASGSINLSAGTTEIIVQNSAATSVEIRFDIDTDVSIFENHGSFGPANGSNRVVSKTESGDDAHIRYRLDPNGSASFQVSVATGESAVLSVPAGDAKSSHGTQSVDGHRVWFATA